MKKPAEIYEEIKDSIVVLNLIGFNDQILGNASGVVVKKNNFISYIITNNHIFNAIGLERIEIGRDGVNISGNNLEIVERDEQLDLLLLSVKGYQYDSLKQIEDSDSLKIGDTVFAIGSPLNYENTFSNGIISGLRKDGDSSRIQFTAPIAGGSSGGALLNESGLLIGIPVEGNEVGSLNFAIPIDLVKKFIEDNIKIINSDKLIHNLIIGDSAMNSMNFEIAIDYYSKCKTNNDNDLKSLIYLQIGKCHSNLENIDKAIEFFTKTIDLKPIEDCYIERGRMYQQNGDLKNALNDYSHSIKFDKFNIRAYVNKAIVLIKMGGIENVKRAKDILNYILEQNEEYKNKADAHEMLGVLYRKEKLYLESITHLQKAVEIFIENLSNDPNYKIFGAEYYIELAITYYYKKEYVRALRNLEEVTNLKPDNPLTYLLKGICFWKLKSFDMAIYNFEECEDNFRNYTPDMIYKSYLGDIDFFNLDIHPKLGRADSYYRTSDIDEAKNIINDLIVEYPNYAELYISYAHLLMRENNPTEALNNYENAKNRYGKSENFLYYSEFDKYRIEREIDKIKKYLNG